MDTYYVCKNKERGNPKPNICGLITNQTEYRDYFLSVDKYGNLIFYQVLYLFSVLLWISVWVFDKDQSYT